MELSLLLVSLLAKQYLDCRDQLVSLEEYEFLHWHFFIVHFFKRKISENNRKIRIPLDTFTGGQD